MHPAIDTAFIGHRFAPFEVRVELGRLKLFAAATGNADPVYRDEASAREAGYASIPLPPTYLFTLEMERDDPNDFLDLLGIDLGRILHGEQAFTYRKVACAGDCLTFQNRIEDIYAKKGGALQFVVIVTDVTNADGEPVAEMTKTIVIR